MAENSDPEAVRKRAMEDPEIQSILGDPAMQMILQQMQKDPNAIKEWVDINSCTINVSPLCEFNSVCRSIHCYNTITIWLTAIFNKEMLRQTELIFKQNSYLVIV